MLLCYTLATDALATIEFIGRGRKPFKLRSHERPDAGALAEHVIFVVSLTKALKVSTANFTRAQALLMAINSAVNDGARTTSC
jgi:hypothetical protein